LNLCRAVVTLAWTETQIEGISVVREAITLRVANAYDHAALSRLAALDSADEVPTGSVLLAEVGGELRAALSLEDRTTIADPFSPTAEIVDLLRARARQLIVPRGRGAGLRRRASAAIGNHLRLATPTIRHP
jgi:hypothetical protein